MQHVVVYELLPTGEHVISRENYIVNYPTFLSIIARLFGGTIVHHRRNTETLPKRGRADVTFPGGITRTFGWRGNVHWVPRHHIAPWALTAVSASSLMYL